MKYLRFGKKPVVLLDECERTLSLAKVCCQLCAGIPLTFSPERIRKRSAQVD